MTSRSRAVPYALLVLLGAGSVTVAAALLLVGRAPAEPKVVALGDVSAVDGMSAVRAADTAMAVTPALVNRLPNDMQAAPGTVHRLMAEGKFTLYAWRRGASDGVCYVSTTAGGGCFGKWIGPFNVSITDFDRIGSGQPAVVSGLVRDDVVGVHIVVDGKTYDARLQNNVAFFELPAASSAPDAVERVTVTLVDGSTERVRL